MKNVILTSILSMAGLGFFFASVLSVVHQKLKVKEDPRVERISSVLPGVNCGACGFASCRLYAETLAKGETLPDRCKAGGEAVSKAISEILGIELEKKAKEIAVLHCGADASKRKRKAVYIGIKTCAAADNMSGGEILCGYGCLGYGDCHKACPFGAITMVNGLPKINPAACTACGKCAGTCPRGLITIEKAEPKNFIYVACASPENGAETRKTCPVGCIACGLCQKFANDVFYVENNLAHVHSDKVKNIADAKEIINKCPTKCIQYV